MFESLIKNPALQKMAFGQLKNIFADRKVKAIVVSINEQTDELVVDIFENPIDVHEPAASFSKSYPFNPESVKLIPDANNPDSADNGANSSATDEPDHIANPGFND